MKLDPFLNMTVWRHSAIGILLCCALVRTGCGGGTDPGVAGTAGAAGGMGDASLAATKAWLSAEPIETNGAGQSLNPQIAIDDDGNAVAISTQSDGTRLRLWSSRFTAGTGWSAAIPVGSGDAGDAKNARIVVDASGNALAVWQQSDGSRDAIWANRYFADIGWIGASVIDDSNADPASAPQISIDAAGNALVVWNQSDGTQDNVWSNHFAMDAGT